jgi:hypothetical protein
MERLGQCKLNVFGDGFRVRFKPSDDDIANARDFGHDFGSSIRDDRLTDDSFKA